MKKLYVIFLLFLTGCSSKQDTASHEALVDLVESTTIIRSLLCQNKLGQLLEEHDPEQLDILINNFSPASMAFESEVLSTTVPLVCAYFYQDSPQEQAFIKNLNALAAEYDNKVKFVIIDAEKLFSIAQAAEINTFPAIAWVRNREIFEYMHKNINVDTIRKKITETDVL
jgi:thioredoxin-like negative regulator of GroEL